MYSITLQYVNKNMLYHIIGGHWDENGGAAPPDSPEGPNSVKQNKHKYISLSLYIYIYIHMYKQLLIMMIIMITVG